MAVRELQRLALMYDVSHSLLGAPNDARLGERRGSRCGSWRIHRKLDRTVKYRNGLYRQGVSSRLRRCCESQQLHELLCRVTGRHFSRHVLSLWGRVCGTSRAPGLQLQARRVGIIRHAEQCDVVQSRSTCFLDVLRLQMHLQVA